MNARIPSFSLLALTISDLLLATGARAGSVAPGTVQDVNAGDLVESWTVGEGATLNVNAGAAVSWIDASSDTLNMNGATLNLPSIRHAISLSASTATIVNSSITSTSGDATALRLLNSINLTDGGPHAALLGSTVSGSGIGVLIAGGSSLHLDNSTVRTADGLTAP